MATIKVNLHGHFSPGFNPYWLKRTGLAGKNIAEEITNRCLAKEISIYTLTSEFPEKHSEDTQVYRRSGYIFNKAREMSKNYELGKLDDTAFVIRRNDGKEVYFLDGKSITINEDSKRYELLTFGSNKVPDGRDFKDTFKFLEDKGLPAIAEHPLMIVKGGIGEKKLREYCEQRKFLAVEHNSQLALPNIFSVVPGFNSFTKKRNKQVIEIAQDYDVPVIASDDSNWPNQIGTSYNEFDEDKIRKNNGKQITNDLIELIKSKNFTSVRGYLPLKDWFDWVVYEILIRERMLKMKK